MSVYRRDLDETKYMSFLIKDDELLEKQGSTNLIFACTDFRACKMVRRARLCTQNYVYIIVKMGTNLHCLIYNCANFHCFFPTYFATS